MTLLASSVTLPRGGSACIQFRASGLPDGFSVSLRLRDGGAPQSFSVTGVSKEAGTDVYAASVSDNGDSPFYSQEVCIEVIDGNGARCSSTSDFICVNCGAAVFPSTVDTGIPVVYINTEGHRPIDSRGIELQSTLSISGSGIYEDLQPCICSVRGRGNSSWNWDKKPLKISLRDRISPLGMPDGSNWVMLANFVDRTLMRNLVAMKVSSLTSLAWTPHCVPVELVLNGSHVGNYLLIEQVEVDRNRVDISRDEGFLLELDFHYDNEKQWLDPHLTSLIIAGTPFAVRYPLPDSLDAARETYIKDYISRTADTIYSKGFADPDTGYGKWIDIDSFIDYWIVNETLGNLDISSPGSVFLYKDGDGKLFAGPCWDYDWCLTEYATLVQEWTGAVNSYAFWYSRLFKDAEFIRRVKLRVAELMPGLQEVAGYIDDCGSLLAASAELNFAMWNPGVDRWRNKGLLINGDENMPFPEAVAKLRDVYVRRLSLLEKYSKTE